MKIPLKEGLLDTIDDMAAAHLLGGRCPACKRVSFPAQTMCPYCCHDGCAAVPLSRRGVVEVCTTVVNRPPGYEGAMPFGFGVVELPEGIRIIARIAEPEHVKPGQRVQLLTESLCTDSEGREVVTYAFKAIDG